MRSLNKKLYTVIAVCLLSLLFTVAAMAENSSSNTASIVSTVSPSASATASENTSGTASNDGSEVESGGELGSDTSNTSELTSGESEASSGSSNLSSTLTSSKTSSKKSYYGNIGGTVSDGIDTSGWGTDEESSEPVSVGTTEKGGSKQINNYETLLWVLIWIPVLLIIASVAALIFVNRKAFLAEEGDVILPHKTNKGNEKSKSNKRTNVYKPRD